MNVMVEPRDELLILLAQILGVDESAVTEETTYKDVERWDSLRQIIIANSLEQIYNVKLTDLDMTEIVSVAAIRSLLLRHEAGRSVPAGGTAERAPVRVLDRGLSLADVRTAINRPLSLNDIHTAADLIRNGPGRAAWSGPAARVAIAGTLTIDFLASAVACAVFQEGSLPDIYEAPYGSLVQEVLNPSSGLYQFKPDVVVLAPDWRDWVAPMPADAGAEVVEKALLQAVRQFSGLWNQLIANAKCKVIQHALVPPQQRLRGLAERRLRTSAAAQVARLNELLFEAAEGKVAWVELDQLAEARGRVSFAGAGYYYTSRMPFDPQYLPDYLAYFRSAWRTANAKAKKVLALDLDNTLWGGVIGDDGQEGIKLGPGSPAGEAFADWGSYIRELAARGIILAVCSKNNPEIAMDGFNHPQAVLKRDDFAAAAISWDDKATNLRRLAADLNVGVDSIVFADDNPFECELVRESLPDVGVVELGTDPTAFISLLEAGRWFDLPAYTKEDFSRAEAYQARAVAESERLGAGDIDSYLRGLTMVGRLYEAREADVARLAQMEQKTNQFNLTTRRYGENEIRAFMQRPEALVMAFELKDRHADHGLVSSLVGVVDGDVLTLESWLMSCRVFSRTAEDFILNALVEAVRPRGVLRIIGLYGATRKNGVVADLYGRLGFEGDGDAEGRWTLDLAAAQARGPLKTFVTAAGAQADPVAAGDRERTVSPSPKPPSPKAAVPQAPAAQRPGAETRDGQAQSVKRVAEAEAALAEGRLEEALAAWQAAAGLDPSNGYAQVRTIETLRALQRHDAADDHARVQTLALPHDAGIAFQWASNAVARADWSAAGERWADALKRFPTFVEPRVGSAEALLHLGRLDQAEDALAPNLYRFPGHERSSNLFGTILARQEEACGPTAFGDLVAAAEDVSRRRDLEEARRLWTRVAQRDPGGVHGRIRLIQSLRDLRRFEEAESYAERLTTLLPDDPRVYFEWASIPSAAGQWGLAFRRWTKGLALFADFPDARHGMAEAAWKMGREDEARSLLETNQRLFPDYPLSGMLLAEILGGQGDWAGASDLLQRLAERLPDRPELGIRRAIALVHAGDPAAARPVIEAVAARHPDSTVAAEYRNWIASLNGDWSGALEGAEALLKAQGTPQSVSLARAARFHVGRSVGRSLVIYGNCQGAVLDGLMVRMRSLYPDFDVVRILGHLPEEAERLGDTRIGEAVAYWEQYDERAEAPIRDRLRDLVPQGARRLVYPSLSLFSLWPLNWPDPRSRAELPRFPHGRYPHDGDVIGQQVAKEGLKGEEAFSRYMDLAARRLGNLQGQFDRDIAQLRRRDAASDVKMTDYVLANYRNFPMFYTWGHVAGEAITEIALQLLDMSRDAFGGDARSDAAQLRSLPTAISDFWMPIHPDVAAWHKLDYCKTADATFNIYGNWWTFKDFMIKYIEYDESW